MWSLQASIVQAYFAAGRLPSLELWSPDVGASQQPGQYARGGRN